MRRVQMDLAESSYERLMKLKEIVEASSYSEVMRDALRLYEFVLKNDAEGNKFLIEDKSGKLVELKIF
jgi:hypothetical protein